eukprot:6176913-Pleurochrysis_carterae.AAC.3
MSRAGAILATRIGFYQPRPETPPHASQGIAMLDSCTNHGKARPPKSTVDQSKTLRECQAPRSTSDWSIFSAERPFRKSPVTKLNCEAKNAREAKAKFPRSPSYPSPPRRARCRKRLK